MSVISVFAIGYVVLAVALFFYQPNLLYFPDIPTREIEATPEVLGLDYEPLTLITSDDEQLDAWFVPADPARGTVLFCHGNAGNISHRLESVRVFAELGLSVFIFDYRGYGRSGGKPTVTTMMRDCHIIFDFVRKWLQQNNFSGPIFVMGRSLGSATMLP